MTFVLLQEAACSLPQGFHLQQRRDVVFSQAVGGHRKVTHDYMSVITSIICNMPFTTGFDILVAYKVENVCIVPACSLGLWLCHEALCGLTGQRFPEAASPGWSGGPV